MSIGEGIIPRINNIKEGDVFKNLRIFHNILSHLEIGMYCNDPKFLDGQVWANNVDPDQME